MSNNIWTSPSRYGTCSTGVKPVSKSTAYRWFKGRTKTRASSTYKLETKNAIAIR